jgi:glycosyltransferase involved in cell wall biosynthesis
MTLSVVSVAFPFARVGPDAVGGAEQVLCGLDAALVAQGHRSIVVAAAGSRVQGELVATSVPAGLLDDSRRREVWRTHRDNIMQAVRESGADVVHMHGIDFLDYLPPPCEVPILATLHLPPSWYAPRVFDLARGDVHLHCVSRGQHAQCPRGTRLLPPIVNGVRVRAKPPKVRRQDFALALGRICAEKNWHAALDAATLADVSLVLAGQVFPYEAHRDYFDMQIRPRVSAQHRFIGPVGSHAKHRLLARARCLLVPSLAPETSSLVAMEALACGTPVVAYANGALPEIVDHGVTGFLVRSPDEMADAIRHCEHVDRTRCHAAARERFDHSRMVHQYFDVYHQLAAHSVAFA